MKTVQPVFDPELLNLKFPEMETDSVEKILNMDEETFRKLFNIPKVEMEIGRSGDT